MYWKKFIFIIVIIIAIVIIAMGAAREVLKNRLYQESRIKSSNGIEALEKITLGGLEQWIFLRGEDKSKPILLWVDGGPGEPLISYARDIGFKSGLEKEFVMVYWDQRGTGKSYNKNISEDDMKIDKYVSDIEELARYLCKRFEKQKIYLLGRSWGTRIGALCAARHPELFNCYIAIGQSVNSLKADMQGYEFALDMAKTYENEKALKELNEIGAPPYDSKKIITQRKWVMHYGGYSIKGGTLQDFIIRRVLISPEYTFKDVYNVTFHSSFSLNHLRDEINKQDLLQEIKEIRVPVYFIEGRYDHMVSSSVAEEFFNSLRAPAGKTLIWFENSGHVANLDEPEKFYDVMVEKILKDVSDVN